MTEFQQATLLVGWVQAGVALFVGMVKSSLIIYGIKRMSDASERHALQTDRQIDAMMRQIDVMADAFARQHEESMKRTDALTGLQEESMKRTELMADAFAMTARGVHEADGRADQAAGRYHRGGRTRCSSKAN